MSTVRVKRPKIRSTAISSRGRTSSKRVPLVSPFTQATLNTTLPNTHTADVPHIPYSHGDDELFGINAPKCAWKQVRNDLYQAYIETKAPEVIQCCVCRKQLKDNYIRCEDCGSFAFYCDKCCDSIHGGQTINSHQRLLYHKPRIWTDTGYKDYHMDIILVRPDHECNTRSSRSGLQVFDEKGRIHHCSLVRCQCEKEECVTLMRQNLWSASTREPKVAFHMELMNWLEFMILESALSLQSACLAIRWKNELTDNEYNTLYNHLVGEPIEELLFYKNMLREYPNDGSTDGIACPACPKEKGTSFISLDANFGLVRKQNGGTSTFGPRHGTRLFTSQKDIDTYVKENKHKVAPSKECNSFQAGSVVRSKNKSVKLDQKAVFGAACRHGIPQIMMSMTEGECLAYPIYALNFLMEQVNGTDVNLHVLYDIACMLESHLKRINKADQFKSITLALPIFHAYGHKSTCQIKYSCRWLDGFGLTDGEVMERLWSYLRQFAKSTKEMTPSHRIDRLTDALLHYARKKKHEMDALLCRNMDKAKYLAGCCTQELEKFKFTNNVSNQDIQDWLKCQLDRANAERSRKRTSGVTGTSQKKQELIMKLHTQAVEYAFVCTLRKKYSSGQAIANRISRSITKVAKNIRKLLSSYNEEVEPDEELQWKVVSNPEADIYKEVDNTDQIQGRHCRAEDRQKSVDLYLQKIRAEEEIQLSKEEMLNCLQWYASQCSFLKDISHRTTSRGERDAIFQKMNLLMKAFQRARLLFSDYLSVSELPKHDLVSSDSLVSRVVVMEEDILQGELDPDDDLDPEIPEDLDPDDLGRDDMDDMD